MFIKADGFVARVAPSDSYCLAIERMGMDGVLALRLTVSGETRTIYAGSNDDKELYPFLLEEVERFHEAFMAENLAIRSGQQQPASDTVFAFRDFYKMEKEKESITPEDKMLNELKTIAKEKGVFCIKANDQYFCSGCGTKLPNRNHTPFPNCLNCHKPIYWFGNLKNLGDADAMVFADASAEGYVVQERYKPFICDEAEKAIAKAMAKHL